MDRAFILQSTYRVERERPVVHLFGVSADGLSLVVRDTRVRPSFFVAREDASRAEPILAEFQQAQGDSHPLLCEERWETLDGRAACQLRCGLPAQVPPLRDALRAAGIDCHEADLPFATRYLIDRGIRGAMRLDGPWRRGRRVARIYEDVELAPESFAPNLRVVALDIETDPQADRIFSFALYGHLPRGGRVAEVHAVSQPHHQARPAEVESGGEAGLCYYHRDEAALLAALVHRLREIDPDLLTGWNVVDFDLTVLQQAFARHALPFHLGRADLPCRLRPTSEPWATSRATVPGRAVIDGLSLLRSAFVRLDDYSLDTAARTILGEGKLFTDEARGEAIAGLYRDDLQTFLSYNLTDARLVVDILDKLDLVSMAVRRVLLTGLPIDRVGGSIAAFDFLYLGRLHQRAIAAPSVQMLRSPLSPPHAAPEAGSASGGTDASPGARAAGRIADEGAVAEEEDVWEGEAVSGGKALSVGGIPGAGDVSGKGDVSKKGDVSEMEEAAEGADRAGEPLPIGGYVLDSIPGLYEQVWLFDYRSLYPSIIRTFRIDPLGFARALRAGEASEVITAPNQARFLRSAGILPDILGELFPLRAEARRRDDPIGATAIKILMNSFYGVLATPHCRFHSTRVSNAITTFGQKILLWTRDRLESDGYRVIYGDTDSVFAISGCADAREAERRGRDVVGQLNEALTDWVRETYGVASHLLLEYERLFLRFFMPALRGSKSGSKKRYAGLVAVPGGTELVVAGLESVRRDWTVLAKDFQRRLLRKVFAGESVDAFVADFVRAVRDGERDGDLIYRKALRKPLEAYGKTTPPHVKAARLMGGRHGRVISYVMTTQGPQPVGETTAPPDYDHYIEKQLRPIAEAILVHLDTSFDEALGRGGQLGLL
ncbi:MAG: DNA polymerase II [Candidatus Eisenbacteria bacterium]|nr:DNA polymerase II [Candidatus Eisenbacteria bacterium]